MIQRLLIANRGEIVLRIIRACKKLQIETVAVYAEDDRNSLAVRMADQAICIGPAGLNTYMNVQAILSAAEATGADSIHPGYGFLSENSQFAKAVLNAGLTFVGPSAQVIELMGNKINAISTMRSHGVPTIPGSLGKLPRCAKQQQRIAKEIGYPVLIKAASGGGGRGMLAIHDPAQLTEGIHQVQTQASTLYADDHVYLEKYLQQPRHVEVQILADSHGRVLCLGDRDCSLQRRHQKVLEEAPAMDITAEARAEIYALCTQAVHEIGYVGLGTIELLYEKGRFYFIEMNTRVQVEHPVTEMVTGLDLIMLQIKAHAGEKITLHQEDIRTHGHAIECRINAEDPVHMRPSPGTIQTLHFPGGPGIRVDSHIYAGFTISHRYDSMIAKIIVHADSRLQAIDAMRQALKETVITGIDTNISLHEKILNSPSFIQGKVHIHFLQDKQRQATQAEQTEKSLSMA